MPDRANLRNSHFRPCEMGQQWLAVSPNYRRFLIGIWKLCVQTLLRFYVVVMRALGDINIFHLWLLPTLAGIKFYVSIL